MKLNLYHSIIYVLEECEESERKEREIYWINKIDCVNKIKYNGMDKEKKYKREKEYRKEWLKKNPNYNKEAVKKSRLKLKNKI